MSQHNNGSKVLQWIAILMRVPAVIGVTTQGSTTLSEEFCGSRCGFRILWDGIETLYVCQLTTRVLIPEESDAAIHTVAKLIGCSRTMQYERTSMMAT